MPGEAYLWHGDERLTLMAERAVWHDESGTLFVADVHLGKDASFRRMGSAVPDGSDADTLARLGALIDDLAPREVVILGDLWHHATGRTETACDRFHAWRTVYPGRMTVVEGNHDRRSGRLRDEWNLELVQNGAAWRGFTLWHEPERAESGSVGLAGHIHPGVRVRTSRTSSVRLPCFWKCGGILVLPAFGTFTGSATVTPGVSDSVFAIADGAVVQIPTALAGAV
ncbi:MAG: ligase-associated DNA damage response endonuclease PdeM [Fimbriimonadaceae bacterium]|nr:ligase-associated DNA damage response endonuclease PdeM [Fimbriimonadaceae bacterium]